MGITELGGRAIYLGSHDIRLGEREAVKDAAMVLSRYVDGIVARTYSHERVVELAKYSSVPVINGLTDYMHPCQALSDLFTINEIKGFSSIRMAYIGDGNNVLHSLLHGCNKVRLKINVSCPKGYGPDEKIVKQAKSVVTFYDTPQEAVEGVDIVYTDVWTSMGKEKEHAKRLNDFKSFQLNSKLLKLAKKDACVMHCLPAHRGEEITDDVLDGKQSIVMDQAENRLHVQKAILVELLK